MSQTLKDRARASLRAIIDRYTAGEAEVVRIFFSRPRAREEYLDMVLRQIGREVQIAHWLPKAGPMGEQLERGVGRWELYETLEHMADEIKHYALLADIAEWLAGRTLSAEELRQYEVNAFWDPEVAEKYLHNPLLPEAAKMVDVTRQLLTDYELAVWKGIVQLSEGGGGGAFIEASRAQADEFQRRFAASMGEIIEDELRHGADHIEEFVEAHIHTEDDLDRAARALTAVMAQHLRVRNEIYGYPLSEERLVAIGRGEIGPPPALPNPPGQVPLNV